MTCPRCGASLLEPKGCPNPDCGDVEELLPRDSALEGSLTPRTLPYGESMYDLVAELDAVENPEHFRSDE